MTTIPNKISNADYLTAVNANFTLLKVIEASDGQVATIASSSSNTILDGNFTALKDNVSSSISLLATTPGISGREFLRRINNNFTQCNTLISPVIYRINSIYVSNNGNDNNDGLTINTPFQTLSKVSSVLQNNTKIYLDKNSVFEETINLNGKYNVALDSYGSGSNAKVTRLKTITGWVNDGGNIWKKQDDNFPGEVTIVMFGATKGTMARKVGSTATGASISNHIATLTDSALSDADGYWTNAEVYIIYNLFSYYMCRVTSYASKTFTFPAFTAWWNTEYAPWVGCTYVLQNHRNCITGANQWAFNSSTKTLYVYSTVEPTTIKACYGENVIHLGNAKTINIDNLTIEGAQSCGIQSNSGKNVFINNNRIQYNGITALYIASTKTVQVIGNSIYESNSNGMMLYANRDQTITDNNIDRSAYLTGQERGYNGMGVGMSGDGIASWNTINSTYLNNNISNSGYSGMIIASHVIYSILENYIANSNINHGDGGAMYLANINVTYAKVLRNICVGGGAQGIYPDLNSSDIEIAYNFCAGFNWDTQLHQAVRCNVHDNIFYGSTNKATTLAFFMNDAIAIGNRINNNLFVQAYSGTSAIRVYGASPKVQYVSGNKYYWPFGKTYAFKFDDPAQNLSLAQWIADESVQVWGRTAQNELEITPSLYAGSAKPQLNFLTYLINPAKTVRTVQIADLPYNDYLDMDGNPKPAPFTMQPYTAIMLVRPN